MISVIIPLYNKEKCIRKTIDSVLNQQGFSDFEVVVVDDGSTDKSCEVVASYQDPRIKLYKKKNGGPSSARNYGVQKAEGEWIVFLDADDYFLPNALKHFAALSQKHSDYSCFASNFYLEKNGIRWRNSYLAKTGICKNPFKKRLTKQFSCRTGAAMFRRRILIKEPFNESLRRLEDAEESFRIIKANTFFVSSIPIMVYNQNSKEASSYRKNPSEDFLMHLTPSAGTFWERVTMYHFYKNACIAYPDVAQRKYDKNRFVSVWYDLALIEVRIYLKINNMIRKISRLWDL